MQKDFQELIWIFIIGTLLLGALLFFMLLYYMGYMRRKQKDLLEKQQLQARHQQELLQTQLDMQEQTLTTISQEIHDNIGQVLSLAKLNLNTLTALPDDKARTKVAAALAQVSKAITDLRNLARSLHSDKIAELGLADAIGSQLTIIESAGLFVTRLTTTGDPARLSPQYQLVLFRMVQELLNNTVKHSGASEIVVTLTAGQQGFSIQVADNGCGFDASQLNAGQTGIGLTNIYRRAALINAKVCVLSSPGGGTTVSIELLN